MRLHGIISEIGKAKGVDMTSFYANIRTNQILISDTVQTQNAILVKSSMTEVTSPRL